MILYLLFVIELLALAVIAMVLERRITGALWQILHNKNLVVGLYASLFLPGVIVHELAHFFIATILLVPVGEVNIIPQIDGENISLGRVTIAQTDVFRRAIVGLAPTLLGLVVVFGALYFLSTGSTTLTWWELGIIIYVLFVISNSMFPSSRDLEGTVEIVIALLIVALALGIPLYYFGFRLSFDASAFFVTKEKLEIMKNVDLYLSVPIILDLLVLSPFLLSKLRKSSY